MRNKHGLRHLDLICVLQVTSVNILSHLLLDNGSWLKSSRDLAIGDKQVLKVPWLSLRMLLCAKTSLLFEILFHAIVGEWRHLLPRKRGCGIRLTLRRETVTQTSKVCVALAWAIQHIWVAVSKECGVAPWRIECEAWVAVRMYWLEESAQPSIVHLHHKMLAAQHHWVVLIIGERRVILAELLRIVRVHDRLASNQILLGHVRVVLLMLC